jgi:uncharacterized protein YdcH (DUF465 family)
MRTGRGCARFIRPAGVPITRPLISRGGRIMFENKQRDDVEALMKADAEFRRLYQHHRELKSKVHDAGIGVLPMDDLTLAGMKKEKLYAKERLQRMWEARTSRIN